MSTEVNKIICSMVKVSKYYEKKPVLADISLSYFYGAKIGVLGLNGAGKSSLLRIMAGLDNSFNGELIMTPGYTVGLLEQEPALDEDRTVRQIVEEGAAETVALLNGSVDPAPGRGPGKIGCPRCLGSGLPPGDGHGSAALPAG
jgi:ATPase subunit of ABC transporter with duplicated ATPase domains